LIEVIPKHGQDIRKKGSDISKEQLVLKSGTKISPIELGLLASIGLSSVKVYKRPKVAILSTGDEVRRKTGSMSLRENCSKNNFPILFHLSSA